MPEMSEKDLDVFKELALHLDKMPIGYPPTESGVEIRLLKHVFTPEQAKLAARLNFMPEVLKKVHRRVKKEGISIEELEKKLDEMFLKGLINRASIKRDQGVEETYYFNAPLVVGIFEFQLDKLTKEFAEDFDLYTNEAFRNELARTKIPQLRTIPIGKSITPEMKIATYDDLKKFIETTDGPIGIQDCICRQKKNLEGESCKKVKTNEVCWSFGFAAKMYQEKGLNRLLSKDEALDIVRMAEKKGLVLQPGNSQVPIFMCMCCGCCCEDLYNKKRMGVPAEFFATNYYAQVDSDLCNGCGTCERRCQMEAVTLLDEKSGVDLDRCIGCGVCVPTCPEKAITLKKKEEETVPAKNVIAMYQAIMTKKAELARSEKS